MKKILFAFAISLLTMSFAQAQVSVLVDGSVPNGGPKLNIGGRASMFMDISPKVQWGLVGRAHRYNYDLITEGGNSAGSAIFNEVSIGSGIKYHFINDVNSVYSFYVQPTFELTTFEEDQGFDLNASVGFTTALSPLMNLVVELGARHRTFEYETLYSESNRFTGYLGMGVSMRVPYFGGSLRNEMKYR